MKSMNRRSTASKRSVPGDPVPPGASLDETLVAAFARGDEHAFDTLFHRHRDLLATLAFNLVGDVRQGEELVRRALVKVFRSRRILAGNLTLRIKIIQALVRGCRRFERRRRLLGLFGLRPRLRIRRILPVHRLDASARSREHVRRTLGARALASLGLKYREAVVLCDLEGLTYEEASVVLGVRPRTVGLRLGRGRILFSASFQRLTRQ